MNDEQPRFVEPELIDQGEQRVEESLRPAAFSEVIGREREKRNLQVMIASARMRDRALDHVLFHGPPGLGKTSLAMVIAKEMGVKLMVTSGPAITKSGDLVSVLMRLEHKDILFIDEIHRLSPSVEEVLYSAMEDRVLDIILGKGPTARSMRMELNDFTVIAATTKLALLSAPLRDRFGVDFRLDFYSERELEDIVYQKARRLGVEIDPDAASEIARRSRMTARVAVRILKRVRDLAIVDSGVVVTVDLARKALAMLEIDEKGLDVMDRKLLAAMNEKFAGRAVGLNTLAASISEDPGTVEDVYEPFLLRSGLIERTPKGRVLTQRGSDWISGT